MAYETPCQKGLAYEPEKHLCDYPDNVYDCQGLSETVVGFKCPSPEELPPNAVARRYIIAQGARKFKKVQAKKTRKIK